MAIAYTGTTGLFTQIGQLVKRINELEASGLAEREDYTEIRDVFQEANLDHLMGALRSKFYDLGSAYASLIGYLVNRVNERLLESGLLLELGVPSASLSQVLDALYRRMVADGASVNGSVATVSALTQSSTGSGMLSWSRTLDRINTPTNGGRKRVSSRPNPDRAGAISELVEPDSLDILCTGDQYRGGSSAVFAVNGEVYESIESKSPNASFVSSSLVTTPAKVNETMETFSGNIPFGWSAVTGVATTNIKSTTSHYFTGATSLELLTAGALASVSLKKLLTGMIPGMRYGLSVAVKAGVQSGTLTVGLTGTGYSAGAPTAEAFTVAITGTPTGGSYTLLILGRTITVPYNTDAAGLQTLIRAATGLGCVSVSSLYSTPNFTHTITMNGINHQCPVPVASSAGLTGGTPAIAVARSVECVEGEKLVVSGTNLPTGWTVLRGSFTAPRVIPSDLALLIEWSGTPSAGSLYIDDVQVTPLSWINGMGFFMVAGATPFVSGDLIQVDMENTEGVFQKFFRQRYGVQLPSNLAGSETIADSLAI
jgi:hypothetical protein